jgi:hypothetical protein
MPVAAFGLKKYLCGASPVSTTADNVDSLTRLGDSEVTAVKHSPSHAIPEVGQRPNDDCEISSFVGREKSWDVFEENNPGKALLNKVRKFVEEAGLPPS